MLLRVDSLASTHAVAAVLAGLARPGDVIVLAGEMGAGKTAFAQGFGRALGVTEAITSPTFTLVHSYPCPGRRLTLHHADLYRLDTTGDVEDLALAELAEDAGVVLVEWGDVAPSAIGDHLEVRLSRDVDPDDGHDVDADADADADVDAGERSVAGLDEVRLIELHSSGPSWAGRWGRLTELVEGYRC